MGGAEDTWLARVRLASVHVGGDRDQLKEAMRGIIEDGEGQNICEGLTRTKKHFDALSKLLAAALTRMFRVLEELGYSPDNPPPDGGCTENALSEGAVGD
jgi:hypothetical protein